MKFKNASGGMMGHYGSRVVTFETEDAEGKGKGKLWDWDFR